MDDSRTCFICQEALDDTKKLSVVAAVGMKTMRAISLERNDAYTDLLNGIESITVHFDCRNKYTLKRKGELRYPSLTDGSKTSSNEVFSPIKKKLRISAEFPDFEFSKCCFICGKEASLNAQLRISSIKWTGKGSARKVRLVKDEAFEKKFLQRLKKVSTATSKAVYTRINSVDLRSVQARYHNKCYVGLFSTANNIMGRPLDADTEKKMQSIYAYIDKKRKFSDECTFILSNLRKMLGNILRNSK